PGEPPRQQRASEQHKPGGNQQRASLTHRPTIGFAPCAAKPIIPWKRRRVLLPCIDVMNPLLNPPGRGTDVRGRTPASLLGGVGGGAARARTKSRGKGRVVVLKSSEIDD